MEKTEFENELVEALPLLYCYAFKLTGNADRAHDLVQEVAVKALTKLACYVTNDNLCGWLYTIVYHTYLNDCRHSSRCVNISDDSFFDAPFDDCVVDSREIIGVVGRLPLSFRVPLEMFVGGYKYCEIAERMNVPIGTVKSRINKARSCLRGRFME